MKRLREDDTIQTFQPAKCQCLENNKSIFEQKQEYKQNYFKYVEVVMDLANVDEDTALDALISNKGDIVNAIMDLTY